MSVERHLSVSRSEIDSLNAALAWAVQQFDKDFAEANMVHLNVEQMMRSDAGEDWYYVWTASVSGVVSEEES